MLVQGFIGILVATFLASVVYLYNRLVYLKQMKEDGLSGIDVQLKRRAELVPLLVETVKGYAAHEKQIFEALAVLRAQARTHDIHDINGREEIETAISKNMASVIAVVENYPALKASENFISLQNELAEIEDDIQMARRYFNGTVRDLNIAVKSFPSNIMASISGYEAGEFFTLDSIADRLPPEISFAPKKQG